MKAVFISMAALAGCTGGSGGEAIVVFAASSLRETATDVTEEWSRRAGRPVRLQFDATSTLARQIRDGAPADLLLTAAPEWLDVAGASGRFDWLSNRLVLVVPRDAPDPDLAALESLALAGEQAPAGRYARAALAQLGIAIPARTVYGANVRDVLSKVSQGGAAAGVVYATDVPVDPGVRVAFTFPPESHPKIVCSAGLLDERARPLFEALREPWAVEIARRHGFEGVE